MIERPNHLAGQQRGGRTLLTVLGLAALFLVLIFWFTAPWTVGGIRIDRLTPVLGSALLLLVPAWIFRGSRVALLQRLLVRPVRISGRGVLFGCAVLTVFLFRFLLSRFHGLEINGWDFSMFDLAIEEASRGTILYSVFFGQSYLAVHASYVLFLLVPLFWIARSPYWLLGIQGLALASATGVGFLAARRILKDDLAALMLALGLFLNSYTAKIAQYAFHIEVFYPLTLLLAALGLLRRSWLLFVVGLILSIAVKEDAVLALTGLALLVVVARREWTWAAAAVLVGGVGFAIAHFLVMPYFASGAPGEPWYSAMWGRYGPTPLKAASAMLAQPWEVGKDLMKSGLRDVLEPMLFLPLIGWEWLLAAGPAAVVYATASGDQLSRFNLYYSAPVLGFVFLGAALGLSRIVNRMRRSRGVLPRRRRLRIGAAIFLFVCAFDGPSYRFMDEKPQRREIRGLVRKAPPGIPIYVQGSLLPHAGYSSSLRPLARIDPLPVRCALLVDPGSNPYPFQKKDIERLVARLKRDSGYTVTETGAGLVLAIPAGSNLSSRAAFADQRARR